MVPAKKRTAPRKTTGRDIAPAEVQAPSADAPAPQGRNIVLFSDGTGNSSAKVFKTNVWRMYEAVDLGPSPSGVRDQISFYDDGVGTSGFKLASSAPRVKTRSSIGTGFASGSAGETRLLGSVSGRAGVAICAATGAANNNGNAYRYFMDSPLGDSVPANLHQ
jgi:hypothetical protein